MSLWSPHIERHITAPAQTLPFRQSSSLFIPPQSSCTEKAIRLGLKVFVFPLAAACALGWAFRFDVSLFLRILCLLSFSGIFLFFLFRGIRKILNEKKISDQAFSEAQKNLLPEGYNAFHNFLTPHGRIDHVLVGPLGIFVINNFMVHAPFFGTAILSFNGQEIFLNGKTVSALLIEQELRIQQWLVDTLRQRLSASFPVKSILAFPDLPVETPVGMHMHPLWVLPLVKLNQEIYKSPVRLDDQEVRLAKEGMTKIILSSRFVTSDH